MAGSIPQSILVVGSGVFGLSTAFALTKRPAFAETKITVLDRLDFPAPDASSVDSSRIIRPDYADPDYLALMTENHHHWRGEFGAEGRYTEAGLCIVTDASEDAVTAATNGGPASDEKGEAGGEYMKRAFQNVQTQLGLKVGRREDGGEIELLESTADINRVMSGQGGSYGSRGYVNWTSGWADAEKGARYMKKLIDATGRVEFRKAEVQRIHYDRKTSRATAVELRSGEKLLANLIILATGAWTPKLIDLRGVASATGQVLAYLELTDEEQSQHGQHPTFICESTGMFIITPRDRIMKVARHGYGYANLVTIPHPERDPSENQTISVSLPRTHVDDPKMRIPNEGLKACRDFLTRTNPSMAARPWTHTRLCWYTDTPSGNWLISYHPCYTNVFVATGGSGHGYKFLPNVGERIVDVILHNDRDALGASLRKKWSWPVERITPDHVWTNDWRGGARGLILDEELSK